MKYYIILLAATLLFSCKEAPKEMENATTIEEKVMMEESKYPEALKAVFEAHGGLANWRSQKTLSYDIPKGEEKETHTIDLYSRKDKVTASTFEMGYDGKEVWLLDESKSYSGDPVFYHNLMFYFYAMPFVLADDGVVYSETPDLEFEGKKYPGIGIGYLDGVGVSPKDEYFIHFDPETKQMAWLGYTVTYRSGEKSDRISWIRYNDWTTVGDVVLPKSIKLSGKPIKCACRTIFFF